MQYLLRQIKDLQPGDHLCLIYETEAEHRAVLTPYLRQGLELGDKVIYIVDARTGETVLGYLQDDGVDADTCVQRGQLVILTVDDAYMREGIFNPDGMIQLLWAETEKALAGGYRALRVSGEMSWALKGLPGSEHLIEYEAKLNDFFPGSQCLAICQYDRRRFDSAMLLDVLATHPLAVVGTEIYNNSFYLPPKDLLGPDPDSARLANRVKNLEEGKRITEALQSRAILLDKRLQCFYGIADLVEEPGIPLSGLLQGLVDLIPPAWQYPEITCACLSLEGAEYKTKNFKETPWQLSVPIYGECQEGGMLRVYYLEERPPAEEGPFQSEERTLLKAIAERICRIIERLRVEQELHLKNRIASIFLSVPDDEMYGEVLEVVLEVMDSAYGIFGYLDEDGTLVFPSMTRDVWEKCRIPDKSIRFPRETWGDSIWGRAMSEKRSLYVNEPGRVPEGHIPMHRVLAVPILFQGEVIGNLVVANKSTNYKVRDQEKLEAIAGYIAPVLQARLEKDRKDAARRRAEEAVAAERQRLFSLLETMPAYVGLLTPDYHVAFANRYFKERFGEPEGRRCYEYLFGRSEPCENCQAYEVLETKALQEYEWLGPDGHTYQISDQLMHDSDGSPLILEMGIDITERKQAERSLAEQFKFLQLLIDTIPSPIFYKDINGIYQGCNQSLAVFLGRPKEAIIGKTVFDVYPKEQAEKYFQMDQELFQHPGTQIYEFIMGGADEGIRNFIFSKATFVDFSGQVAGLIGVMTDITERRQAEEEVRSAASKWRKTFDAIRDGVCLLDQDSKILQCNQAFADLVGKPFPEILSRHCWELVQCIDPTMQDSPLTRIRQSRHRETMTIPLGDRWYHMSADPILGSDSAVTGAVFTITDITDYHQATEKINNLNILLQAIKKIDEALLRIKNETELFQHTCDLLVDIPYVRFTWIGIVQPDSFELKAVVWAGHEDGYLSTLRVTWDDSSYGQGPGGSAIRTKQPAVINNIDIDPWFLPWRDEALKRGYASVAVLPLLYEKESLGGLAVYSGTKNAFGEKELEFFKQVASDIAVGIRSLRLEQELIQSFIQLQVMMLQTVEAIASMAELRDPYTAGHQRGVTKLACALGNELGLEADRIEGLRIAGFLHDIGKIVVPTEILNKPVKLNDYELNIIKTHSQAGYDILKKIDFPWPVAQIVLQHHERINGSGYPRGLQGADILQEAKILAVADVVEAMAAYRPYRPALGLDRALEEITKNKGILYDPEVAEACLKLFTEKGFRFEAQD